MTDDKDSDARQQAMKVLEELRAKAKRDDPKSKTKRQK